MMLAQGEDRSENIWRVSALKAFENATKLCQLAPNEVRDAHIVAHINDYVEPHGSSKKRTELCYIAGASCYSFAHFSRPCLHLLFTHR
jgi:hypothetical protein